MAADIKDVEGPLSDDNFAIIGQSSGQNTYDSEEFIDDFDDAWHAELDDALLEGFVDHSIIRNICRCRILPRNHRSEVWKICLNIASRGNALSSWDGKLDLPEQNAIHQDCEKVVTESQPEDAEQATSDLESIITFYCKSRALKYDIDYAWTNLLRPLFGLTPRLDRADLYNCFYAILARYIPRESLPDAPYNLFRLLLLYHDPELCSFFDSRKVTMQMFMKPWFRTLFASHCKPPVAHALWDVYLQRADPFYMFFLALVILVNAKEQVMNTMLDKDKDEIASAVTEFPGVLECIDVEDFCQLAMYFSDRTPQSIRKNCQDAMFSGPMSLTKEVAKVEKELAQSFCFQIGVPDILLSAQPDFTGDEPSESTQVRFFLVDCRSPDHYNAGHLNTAFHLDATLMLREPKEFAIAIEALRVAQEQAIQAGSAAGGEHLCLIGSGNDEEDQYMYMVVAHLLKNHRSYVSTVRGGFKAILTYLTDANIDMKDWIEGTSSVKDLLKSLNFDPKSSPSKNATTAGSSKGGEPRGMESLMRSFTTTLKTKSYNIKEKVTKFMENTEDDMSHVNKSYNGKPYRGTQPVFSIGDEDEHSPAEKAVKKLLKNGDSDVDEDQLVDLKMWLEEHDIKNVISCSLVLDDRRLVNAHLVIDGDDLVCLREYKTYSKSKLVSRNSLMTVLKITSKKSCPEIITFRFSDTRSEGEASTSASPPQVTKVSRYYVPEAGPAMKYVKQEIVKRYES